MKEKIEPLRKHLKMNFCHNLLTGGVTNVDIIEFSKKINYPDFKHDIIEYFSENAALYQIISKTSDISIDATVEENGSISYILSLEDNDIINLLENLLNDPITMFLY